MDDDYGSLGQFPKTYKNPNSKTTQCQRASPQQGMSVWSRTNSPRWVLWGLAAIS